MKVILKQILFFQILLVCSCNNNLIIKNESGKDSKTMILQSEMLVVDCGNEAYVYGLMFKSLESELSIIGIIRCPDGYGQEFFKKGHKYNLEYTDDHIADSIKGYIPMNPYSKSGLKEYLITEIGIAK